MLNLVFREVATFSTNRENHKYKSSYENSLLVKRFIFEFFDCFLPLMYFGWWEMNFKVLRQNVIALYVADEIRRIVCETIIPYLL
jgi:anoctamin-10